jgi:hypothetical protein
MHPSVSGLDESSLRESASRELECDGGLGKANSAATRVRGEVRPGGAGQLMRLSATVMTLAQY